MLERIRVRIAAFAREHPRPIAAAVLAAGLYAGYALFLAPPYAFPSGATVSIADGESGAAVATVLAEDRIVKNPLVLRALLRLSGTGGRVQAGVYRFERPENVLAIAYRLIVGDFAVAPVRITFPEGLTVRDMAVRVAEALPGIPAGTFAAAAAPYEGYLFPDTYAFAPDASADSVIAAMRATFAEKIAPLLPAIASSGHSVADTVVMASLVEKEARTPEARKMVAGILWNRIKAGMPLQVDAVFGYINNRATYSPSLSDLSIDSPYNTYTHTGLPPGPIDNPGFDSLDAAANPTPSPYLYYLTGADGAMHYATTFAEHKANRAAYLP